MILDQYGREFTVSSASSMADWFAEEQLNLLKRNFMADFMHVVTLYDPFGFPIDVPSTQPKIGQTIYVRTPAKFSHNLP